MINTILELKEVTYKYKKNIIINKANLQIKNGDRIALLGKSGAGKVP